MRFVSFASSSSGNSALISYKNTNVLVDCGISRKRIIENLEKYDLTLDDIDCIFLTHSHSDHIQGLPMVLKYNNIKVAGLRETLIDVYESLEKNNIKINYDNFKIIKPMNLLNDEHYITLKDIKICPLKGCHDKPSLYYKFILGDIKIAILTDIGRYNDLVLRNLSDVDYMMLECNYDYDMLMNSSRPPELKARIIGIGGHLSNKDCSEILEDLFDKKLKTAYLSHISDEANSEEYALQYVTNYFIGKGKNEFAENVKIARRLEMTEIIINNDL